MKSRIKHVWVNILIVHLPHPWLLRLVMLFHLSGDIILGRLPFWITIHLALHWVVNWTSHRALNWVFYWILFHLTLLLSLHLHRLFHVMSVQVRLLHPRIRYHLMWLLTVVLLIRTLKRRPLVVLPLLCLYRRLITPVHLPHMFW